MPGGRHAVVLIRSPARARLEKMAPGFGQSSRSALRVFVCAAGLQGGGPEEPAITEGRHSGCHLTALPIKCSVIAVMCYVFRGSGSAQAESCSRSRHGCTIVSRLRPMAAKILVRSSLSFRDRGIVSRVKRELETASARNGRCLTDRSPAVRFVRVLLSRPSPYALA